LYLCMSRYWKRAFSECKPVCSGHGAMKENYYLDDGTYSASQIVIEMVRSRRDGKSNISDLLKQLKEPQDAHEFRLKLKVHLHKPSSLLSAGQ
jgi:hypothetical protein